MFTVAIEPCLKSDIDWDIHSNRVMQAQQSTLNNQISLSQTSLAVIPRGKGEPPLEHMSGQTITQRWLVGWLVGRLVCENDYDDERGTCSPPYSDKEIPALQTLPRGD